MQQGKVKYAEKQWRKVKYFNGSAWLIVGVNAHVFASLDLWRGEMRNRILFIGFSILVTLFLTSNAKAISLDFESGVRPPEISGGSTDPTEGFSSYGFGSYFQWTAGNAITLLLESLESHTKINISFDLAVIDSWDGSHTSISPDYINVTLDDITIFKETFDNWDLNDQSYGGSPTSWGTNLAGINENSSGYVYNDAAYHISLTGVSHNGSSLLINWFANGAGWQGGDESQGAPDESFAIDNIMVIVHTPPGTPVSEPTTMLLFGTGLAGLVGFSRRKTKEDITFLE